MGKEKGERKERKRVNDIKSNKRRKYFKKTFLLPINRFFY